MIITDKKEVARIDKLADRKHKVKDLYNAVEEIKALFPSYAGLRLMGGMIRRNADELTKDIDFRLSAARYLDEVVESSDKLHIIDDWDRNIIDQVVFEINKETYVYVDFLGDEDIRYLNSK